MKNINYNFEYVSVYIIGDNGDLSIGAPFCRNAPNKTYFKKNSSEKNFKEIATLNKEDLKILDEIITNNDLLQIKKYNSSKKIINIETLQNKIITSKNKNKNSYKLNNAKEKEENLNKSKSAKTMQVKTNTNNITNINKDKNTNDIKNENKITVNTKQNANINNQNNINNKPKETNQIKIENKNYRINKNNQLNLINGKKYNAA